MALPQTPHNDIDRIYQAWNDALAAKDLPGECATKQRAWRVTNLNM